MSPHLVLASLVLHVALLAAKTKKTTGSSFTLILIVLVIAAFYFLILRPGRQRARRQQQTQKSVEIGDEVMLTSGIIGRVAWLEGDRARLEIANGVEIEVLRAAIARPVPASVPSEEPEGEEEEDGKDASDGSSPTIDQVLADKGHAESVPPRLGPSDGDGQETS